MESLVHSDPAFLASNVTNTLGNVQNQVLTSSGAHPTNNFTPGNNFWFFWRPGGYVGFILLDGSF